MQAMILAAGFGTRLLPHTTIRPKPLFPLLNKPLLLLTIERLRSFGCKKIVVNCHHLAEQIEASVAGIPDVIVQKEEMILGTGGGLQRARKYFDDEPLLVTNGDIYHTLDLRTLYAFHLEHNCPVTMAMHDCARFNTVRCQGEEVLSFDAKGVTGSLAFTGLHVINPQILEGIAEGFSCIIERYRSLLKNKEKIACFRADHECDFYWTDIGTPADYLNLQEELLSGKIPVIPGLTRPANMVLCEAVNSNSATFTDWAVVGKAHLGKGCHITRSVIWDGVQVPPGKIVEDSLLSGAINA